MTFLVMTRSNMVCRSQGYHSAIDFKLKTDYDDRKLIVFNKEGKEEVIDATKTIRYRNLIIDGSFLAVTTGGALVVGAISKIGLKKAKKSSSKIIRFLSGGNSRIGTLFMAYAPPLIYSVDLYINSRKQVQNLVTDKMYTVPPSFFSHTVCLNIKGQASDEEISRYTNEYTCYRNRDLNSYCDSLNDDQRFCAISLSNNGYRAQEAIKTCNKIIPATKNEYQMQCAVIAFNGGQNLKDSISECKKINNEYQLRCVGATLYQWNKYYEQDQCLKSVNAPEIIPCVVNAKKQRTLSHTVNQCQRLKSGQRSQCVIDSVAKGNFLETSVNECYKISFLN